MGGGNVTSTQDKVMEPKNYVYGLVAKGDLAAFSEKGRTLCGKVFSTEQKALDYIPIFRKAVTENREDSLENLVDNIHLKISLLTLEVDSGDGSQHP